MEMYLDTAHWPALAVLRRVMGSTDLLALMTSDKRNLQIATFTSIIAAVLRQVVINSARSGMPVSRYLMFLRITACISVWLDLIV